MRFNTLVVIAISSLALASAKPHAMMKRYGNETTPAFTSSSASITETISSTTSITPLAAAVSSTTTTDVVETLPTVAPANTTVGANNGSSLTPSEVLQISTSINTATLTYTLGPEGSSSVITTTVEETTTIKMTSTMYVTVTSYSDSSSATPESTTTVTHYSTTTKTLTLQAVATDNADTGSNTGSTPGQPSNGGSFFQSGNPDSLPVSSANPDANSGFSNPGLGGCGVTTVTATIYEQSTVTVTPLPTSSSSTDVLPIAPTASPSYGFGNGTDSTGPIYGSASSGFLTLHRPQPTGF